MGIRSLLGIRGARDKPRNSYAGSALSFLFGRNTSGKPVNERTVMQTTAVYSRREVQQRRKLKTSMEVEEQFSWCSFSCSIHFFDV